MTAESAILQYWNEIRSGGISAGKWIRLLYEVILQGLSEHLWYYSHERADNAIRFIERYCHHYKGKLAPQRIKLSLWERATITLIFGIGFPPCLYFLISSKNRCHLAHRGRNCSIT